MSTSQSPFPIHSEAVAERVERLPILFVNAYAVSNADGSWVLIDTGVPGAHVYLRPAVLKLFGRSPSAIILTHGHFDHAGSAFELADGWDVPIYAHTEELPFLTGRSDYAPGDSSMGGAIAQMARLFPSTGYNFGRLISALPADGSVPYLPGWQWIHTPGHTPGHVSFWREADRTLLAGDAFATMDMDSWAAHLTHSRELGRSPVPFVADWDAAEESVRHLAELRPQAIGAGHGRAMQGADLAEALAAFAQQPQRPEYGRYAVEPAHFDANQGLVSTPPPVADRALWPLLGGLALTAFVAAALFARHSSDPDQPVVYRSRVG